MQQKSLPHFIIGVSLDNSYFSTENISRVISYVESAHAGKNFIMIPDKPAVYTMRAKGIETNQAEKKARLKSNNIENKCVKALTADTHIIRWNSIENHSIYIHGLAELENYYDHNDLFKKHVDVVVRSVLEKTLTHVSDESLYIGSRFLLQELAFISWSPDILGVHETRYIYHAEFDILQNLLSGLFGIPTHKNVSFEIFA